MPRSLTATLITLMVVCEISVNSLMMYLGRQSVQQSLKIKTQETPSDSVGYIRNVYDENCSLLLVIPTERFSN
jgi:hypothetical protein